MKNSQGLLISILACIVILVMCCFCMVSIICAASYNSLRNIPDAKATFLAIVTPTKDLFLNVTPTLQAPASIDPIRATPRNTITEFPDPESPTMSITPKLTADVPLSISKDTLKALEVTIVPLNDPIDLAQRLENKQNLPTHLEFPLKAFQVGDQETFWVINADDNKNYQVKATLAYITDHVYFWVEDDVPFNERHVKALVETFENKIYPTNREFFGSEWIPGVDADPHLYILYVRRLGGTVAGYYSHADEYLPIVREYSNGHEMFFLSADSVSLDKEYAYSVLAHEFQHMIHWHLDRNEETWMNEGFSDLAMLLNGYSIGGADQVYALDPDIQLNDWPTESSSRISHYGASFLFMTYFLDRFGEEATKMLVADSANGMVSIDQTLAALGITDRLNDKTVNGLSILGVDDVFADWVIASYLQDEKIEDGRYTYHNYPGAPNPSSTLEIKKCPTELNQYQVSQYGVDYIRIRCPGDYVLHFEGLQQVSVVPENPHSGSYAFYSNRGDESDMTLTKTFDFRNYSGPLTFKYWTWYNLEQDYDYLYLTASLDGKTWQILTTPSGTADDPSGNSYGWAYNGLSGDEPKWIQEEVDISHFAGREVQLRFEYVTDSAVNGEGFLLDDVAIPEINYSTDFENDDGGWQADGFVRINNILPQTFRLSMINVGHKTTVEKIELPPNNILDIPIHIDDELIFLISGTTRFTRQKAVYQFSVQP